MKTHTIHETNTELLFVPYPNDGNIFTTGITDKNPIPDGFEFIGLTKDVKEQDLVDVMPKVYNGYNEQTYKMYKGDIYSTDVFSSLQSLTSLMEFLQLPNQPHVLLIRKI